MRTISSTQQLILDGQTSGIVALLMELEHPDGTVRMSSLSGGESWVDGDAIPWLSGGGILTFGPTFTRMGVTGGALTVTWNGADPDLMSKARDGKVAGAPFTRYIAFIDSNGAQVGDKIVDFKGICETPSVSLDPSNPTITLTVESRVLRLRRKRTFRYTPESQARYFPGDTGFDFVAGLQDVDPFDKKGADEQKEADDGSVGSAPGGEGVNGYPTHDFGR